jgi:hypothetical protein
MTRATNKGRTCPLCGKPAWAGGLCCAHYQKARRTNNPTPAAVSARKQALTPAHKAHQATHNRMKRDFRRDLREDKD